MKRKYSQGGNMACKNLSERTLYTNVESLESLLIYLQFITQKFRLGFLVSNLNLTQQTYILLDTWILDYINFFD